MANVTSTLSKVFKTAFPFIGTAATIFGGPAVGSVVTKIGQALGAQNSTDPTSPPSLDSLGQAYLNATPDQITAAMKVESDYKVQMQQAGYQNATDIEKLAVEDRESARAREIAVKDYTPEVGFYLLTAIFFAALYWVCTHPIPTDNKALAYTMLGSLGTVWVMAATYFYGTSRGSQAKDQLLADSVPADSVKGK